MAYLVCVASGVRESSRVKWVSVHAPGCKLAPKNGTKNGRTWEVGEFDASEVMEVLVLAEMGNLKVSHNCKTCGGFQ